MSILLKYFSRPSHLKISSGGRVYLDRMLDDDFTFDVPLEIATDTIVFETRPGSSNRDTITDYDPKRDSIYLDNAVFTKLGKKGSLEKPAKLSTTFFEPKPPNDANSTSVTSVSHQFR